MTDHAKTSCPSCGKQTLVRRPARDGIEQFSLHCEECGSNFSGPFAEPHDFREEARV